MEKLAIVGAGLSGLSLAYFLKKRHPQLNIEIFEAEKIGGQVQSEIIEECVIDAGPESYLAKSPILHHLAEELDIMSELVAADAKADKKFLIKDGRLVKLPTGPMSFLFNSVIFFPQKIKGLLAFGKGFSLWQNMSVFDVAKTIMGETFAEYFASAFTRGVYGCEAEDVEFSAIFPRLFALLSKKKKLKEAMKESKEETELFWSQHLAGTDYKSGLYSFKGGLSTLTTALEDALKKTDVTITNSKIIRIQGSKQQYYLQSKNQKYGTFEKVYFSCSTDKLARIFKDFDKAASVKFNEMKFSPLAVVAQGFRKKDFNNAGFGFLCPRKEQLPFMGTLFSSNIFPYKAPKDIFLTKTMIAGDMELFKDDEIIDMANTGLKRVFKIKSEPIFSKVYRYNPGMPRYYIGYSKWKDELHTLMKNHENLQLHGWFFHGIGMPACLEASFKEAMNYKTIHE